MCSRTECVPGCFPLPRTAGIPCRVTTSLSLGASHTASSSSSASNLPQPAATKDSCDSTEGPPSRSPVSTSSTKSPLRRPLYYNAGSPQLGLDIFGGHCPAYNTQKGLQDILWWQLLFCFDLETLCWRNGRADPEKRARQHPPTVVKASRGAVRLHGRFQLSW